MSSLQAQGEKPSAVESREQCIVGAASVYASWLAEVAAQGGVVAEEVAA
ncbi:hypothetical protein [Glutamicibacter sp. PS]|nr:hypothetical protein [Glutamicibacter sp. PS]MDR4533238.1 hypothetical protein [Glutamicibacter sp. PS]